MLGVIVMLACFILVGVFALMNQDVPDAVLKVWSTWGMYKVSVAPWLLIALSLFVGAILQFLVSHGREMALQSRLREKEDDLLETRSQLRRFEDAVLDVVPRRPEVQLLEGHDEQLPPEEGT